MPSATRKRRASAYSSPVASSSRRTSKRQERQVDAPLASKLSTTTTFPALDSTMFPHLLDSIVSFMPYESLVVMRAVSRGMRDRCDAHISQHLVLYCPMDARRDPDLGELGAGLPVLATPYGRIPVTYFISQFDASNGDATCSDMLISMQARAHTLYRRFKVSMANTHLVDVVGPLHPDQATIMMVMHDIPPDATVRLIRWRYDLKCDGHDSRQDTYEWRDGTVVAFHRLTLPAGGNTRDRMPTHGDTRPQGSRGLRRLVHTYLFHPRGDMKEPIWTSLTNAPPQELVVHFYREGPQNRFRLRATDHAIVDGDPLRGGLPHVAGLLSALLDGVADTLLNHKSLPITIVNLAALDPECFFMRPEASDEEVRSEVERVILAIVEQEAADDDEREQEPEDVSAAARERLRILTVDEYVASVGAAQYAIETDVKYTYELGEKKRKKRKSGAAA